MLPRARVEPNSYSTDQCVYIPHGDATVAVVYIKQRHATHPHILLLEVLCIPSVGLPGMRSGAGNGRLVGRKQCLLPAPGTNNASRWSSLGRRSAAATAAAWALGGLLVDLDHS